MSRLTRDGTAESVSRDQIFGYERGQGNIRFPCLADHEQDWQPYQVDLFSCYMCNHTYIQNNGGFPRYYTVDPMLLLIPTGNPFKCHEEVLYLQPMIPPPPKRFHMFSHLTEGCSEGLDAFRFFLKSKEVDGRNPARGHKVENHTIRKENTQRTLHIQGEKRQRKV